MSQVTEASATPMTPDQARAALELGLHAMATGRWLAMRAIEQLTPAQWMHQVSPGSNHVMFNIGHLAHTDRLFLLATGASSRTVPQSYEVLFNAGCQPSDRAADYPDPAEVMDVFQSVRAELVERLRSLSDQELLRPAAEDRLRDIVPTIAHLPGFIVLHDGTHTGQILLVRRSLGLPGVLGM